MTSTVAKKTRTQIMKNRQALRKQHCNTQSGICLYCDCVMNHNNTRDDAQACSLEHIVPRILGGKDTALNTIAVCGKCNNTRGHNPLSNKQIISILRYKGIPGGLPVATVLYHEFIAWGSRQLFTTPLLVVARIPV